MKFNLVDLFRKSIRNFEYYDQQYRCPSIGDKLSTIFNYKPQFYCLPIGA